MTSKGDGAAALRIISPPRLATVDLLRGVAIVLMSLDHVREFLQAEQVDPLDLSQTTPALFLTRWITHFCPAVFVLLAGAGIGLGASDAKPRTEQVRFVLVRGIWLVMLELTFVHLGWFFNWKFHAALGQVIWVIGWSMICMAGLIFLPTRWIVAIGLVLIGGHNAFDRFDALSPQIFGSWNWIWSFLHGRGLISWNGFSIYIAYPLIPWVGVMAVGWGFGRFLRGNPPDRSRRIAWAGWLLIALFAVFRGLNIYGDPSPWSPQSTPMRTLLALLNCQKYPPSLAYLLMTLGPVLAAWPLWEKCRGPLASVLMIFGRVPLFFYLVHLFVIHGLTVGIVYLQTGTLPPWLWSFPPGHAGPGTGLPLWGVYLVWLGVMLLHVPLCLWYGRLKQRNPDSMMRFL